MVTRRNRAMRMRPQPRGNPDAEPEVYNRAMRSTYDLLFARPSFLEGVSRVLDLAGTVTEFNESITGDQADLIALTRDWRAVGFDLHEAMKSFAVQSKDHRPNVAQRPTASSAG